jgi:hypothetical protein
MEKVHSAAAAKQTATARHKENYCFFLSSLFFISYSSQASFFELVPTRVWSSQGQFSSDARAAMSPCLEGLQRGQVAHIFRDLAF